MHPTLAELPDGHSARVKGVVAAQPGQAADNGGVGPAQRRRLAELGFLPGETVQVLHRGPGGREPLAVAVGDAVFALRLVEARCIELEPLDLVR